MICFLIHSAKCLQRSLYLPLFAFICYKLCGVWLKELEVVVRSLLNQRNNPRKNEHTNGTN